MTTKDEQEVVLMALMLECLVRQIDHLEDRFRFRAKHQTNKLIAVAQETLKELYRDMPEGAQDALMELYDFIYATVRDAAHVPIEDIGAFRKVVSEFTIKYPTIKLNLLNGTEG